MVGGSALADIFFKGAFPLLLVAAGVSFGEAENAVKVGVPVLRDDVIRCLNKEIAIDPERGTFVILADGEPLFRSSLSFKCVNRSNQEVKWYGNTSLRVKRTQEGGRYCWEGHLDLDQASWLHTRQEFELLSNGLFRVTVENFPCPRPELYEVGGDSIYFSSPVDSSSGCSFATNGVVVKTEPNGRYGIPYRQRDKTITFWAGDPARELRFISSSEDGVKGCGLEARKNGEWFFMVSNRGRKTFYFDVRRGTERRTAPHMRGGVDFMKVEKLEMPDNGCRNLFPNGSFESGFKGWNYRGGLFGDTPDREKRNREYYALDSEEKKFGRRSLRCLAQRDPRGNRGDARRLDCAVHLGSMQIVPDPGRYTLSFWAKAKDEGCRAYMWSPYFLWGEYPSSYVSKTKEMAFRPVFTTEWRRYSYSFEIKQSDPWQLMMNFSNVERDSVVWVDGFQLEKGEVATDYAAPLVEARLVTSEKENFIDSGNPVNARLELVTTPSAAGSVEVQVKLMDGKVVRRVERGFAADASGFAVVPLDLENLGDGLFILKSVFRVGDGTSYQHDRLTVVKYATHGRFRWLGLFGNSYGDQTINPVIDHYLDRYRKIGIGANYTISEDPFWHQYYRDRGIDPGATMMCWYCLKPDPGEPPSARARGRRTWGIFETQNYARGGLYFGRPGMETKILDHKDAGVELDEAYLAKFKEAVKERVKKFPHIRRWEFIGEFSASIPLGWWSERRDPIERARMYAKYLKAFVEGVREANPAALAMNDGPCNMSDPGVREIKEMLTELAKLGVKLEAVAAHPYRYAPENPDLDAHVKELMDHLRSLGYPETTPFHFGEMMHWGPYEVPKWGLQSSTWSGPPRTWPGDHALSYDLGVTERRSAAWRARSWLVGLKYAPRVLQMESGSGNNFAIDLDFTPRLTQLVSATLVNLLGNSKFVADVRFAPHCRAYVFDDGEGRPVAAVWCHRESVDFEREAAPEAVADFGDSLEGVFAIDGHFTAAGELADSSGSTRFGVTGCPRYFRGRRGTMQQFLAAVGKTRIVSGAIARKQVKYVRAVTPDVVEDVTIDLVTGEKKAVRRNVAEGTAAAVVPPVPENCDSNSIDWNGIPVKALGGTNAEVRLAWNGAGLHLRIEVDSGVKDVAVYLDPFGDAKGYPERGYGEDDYEYHLVRDSKGAKAWRTHGADQQLGIGVAMVRRDNAWCPSVKVGCEAVGGRLVYRAFFPFEDLLPLKLEKGSSFGFAVGVDDAKLVNRPFLWNDVLLWK